MVWVLLAIALLCGLFLRPSPRIAGAILCLALLLAVYQQILAPAGILSLLVIALVMAARHRYRHHRSWAVISESVLLLCCLGLFLHVLPGFHHPHIVDSTRLGPLSAPFTLYLNLDKALVPAILLACLPTLLVRGVPPVAYRYYWAGPLLSIPLLLGLATALGGLRPEPHFPGWLGWFVLSNLFFVSLAEEALFRGYLLQRLWDLTRSRGAALGISALLFGLAHLAGGWMLVLFATLAGILYGLVWLWSGRLWVTALFHFLLNLIHLLFFTYPFYQAIPTS